FFATDSSYEVVMTINASKIPYVNVLQFTDEIMLSLVSQTEATISAEIEKFKANGPESFEIEISAEDEVYDHIEHYHGLSDKDVCLDETFLEFFPSLNRRSVFQTIYGIYEVDLLGLCRSYHKELGGKKPDNFDGNGIVKAHNFLSRHYPEISSSQEWLAIDQLRVLRNKCVHSNGCIFNKGNRIEIINDLIQSLPDLFHHDGFQDPDGAKYSNGSTRRLGRNIVLEKGSLDYIIHSFQAYVKLVDSLHTKARA
ncbi:hypothetical protein ACVD2U_004468, partial [Vibrio parahaemolyticus]